MTNSIPVESFDGGLQAVFINMPHFRTSSARLTINAGSLHEPQEAAGAAHFLEHIAFQGTEDMPTEENVHRYMEDRGLSRNAFTSHAHTSYSADGYDLESVVFFVSQTALFPRLEPDALERERKPIIDEIRGRTSNPHYAPTLAHSRAQRGYRYARPIAGTIEDVQVMTHEYLTEYHARNYRLGNAVLVICSSEPVERQREHTERLIGRIKDSGPTPEQALLAFPEFNPNHLDASLQQVDLPSSAQTSISIHYGLPETRGPEEQLSYDAVGEALSKMALRRLRNEMAICYDAHASTARIANLNFGADQNWNRLTVCSYLNGEDAVPALDAMYDDVINKELPDNVLQSIFLQLRRSVDHLLEANPARIAKLVQGLLADNRRDSIDLEEARVFADSVSIDHLRQMHRDIAATKPLVTATSPSPAVLERVGDWAAQHLNR